MGVDPGRRVPPFFHAKRAFLRRRSAPFSSYFQRIIQFPKQGPNGFFSRLSKLPVRAAVSPLRTRLVWVSSPAARFSQGRWALTAPALHLLLRVDHFFWRPQRSFFPLLQATWFLPRPPFCGAPVRTAHRPEYLPPLRRALVADATSPPPPPTSRVTRGALLGKKGCPRDFLQRVFFNASRNEEAPPFPC